MRQANLPSRLRVALNLLAALLVGALILAEAAAQERASQSTWGTVRSSSPARFSLTATASGLRPGVTRKLLVRIKNPFAFPIKITKVTIQVRPDPQRRTCAPRKYVRKMKPTKSRTTVPRKRTRKLKLQISMTPTAPDVCQGATFPLRLEGKAVRA